MPTLENRPCLSFVVFAYNQQSLVRESVAAALAQTYSPLEIVLSDDCSTDGTFQIMQELAAAYQGPHRIVLNRNPSNLGPARHVNHVMDLVHGALVVFSAGDDVSLPHRTESLFEAWDSTGRTATLVHSKLFHIGAQGEPIQHTVWRQTQEPTHRVIEQPASPWTYVQTLQPGIFGCAAAYAPVLFRTFGGLPDDLIHEDSLLTLRSAICGRVVLVDSPLVKYRLHGGNLFNVDHSRATTLEVVREQERRMRQNFSNRAAMYRAFQQDLQRASQLGLIAQEEYERAMAAAERKARIYRLEASYLKQNPIQKLGTLLQLVGAGTPPLELKELSFRLLPMPLFYSAKWLRGRLLGASPPR